MTPSWKTLRPAGRGPFVLTCEHASPALPWGPPGDPAERAVLRSHWGVDLGAWAATRRLSRALDAVAVGGRFSRLVVDLNRRADDPTLVRREAGGVALSWNRGVTAAEVERRLLGIHVPYHDEVDRRILARVVRGRRPTLVAVHSFTPDWEGERRAFDVGLLYDEHAALARRVARSLRAAGLVVRYNRPYSGILGMMYAIDRHGRHHGLPCLEIELNQGRIREPRRAAAIADATARALAEAVR